MAAISPTMRFVGTKSEHHQSIQSLHRVRESFVKRKAALSNEIRTLLYEFGIVIAKGVCHNQKRVPQIIEDLGNGLPIDVSGERECANYLVNDGQRHNL